jgi:hypothetical protein
VNRIKFQGIAANLAVRVKYKRILKHSQKSCNQLTINQQMVNKYLATTVNARRYHVLHMMMKKVIERVTAKENSQFKRTRINRRFTYIVSKTFLLEKQFESYIDCRKANQLFPSYSIVCSEKDSKEFYYLLNTFTTNAMLLVTWLKLFKWIH